MSNILVPFNNRTKGYVSIGDKNFETRQCVHCGRHWQYIPGSRKLRGFCTKCMGPTCGCKQCDPCIPFMKKLGL